MGCRRRAPQDELVRVVAAGGGLVTGRTLPGRGAWLCRASPSCLDAAVRRGGLARALRTTVDPRAAEALREQLGTRPTGPLEQAPAGVWEDVRPRPSGRVDEHRKD